MGLYYLQSRYYDPDLCRFLNADAYVSTGQGELGNNMFAYCGNNPTNMSDPTGFDYDPIIIRKGPFYAEVTHTYGGVRQRYYETGCAWLKPIRQEIESIKEQIEEADSIDDYIDIGKRILNYEIIADPLAAYKTPAGIKKMVSGFNAILLPFPTYLDDIWGGFQVAWGFASVVTGIGELFDWSD